MLQVVCQCRWGSGSEGRWSPRERATQRAFASHTYLAMRATQFGTSAARLGGETTPRRGAGVGSSQGCFSRPRRDTLNPFGTTAY